MCKLLPKELARVKIYKYSSLDSAIKIIKSGRVLLNKPSEFNDPFDSKLFINNKNFELTNF